MPDVPCAYPGCPELISDPCYKVSGLFQIKMNLENDPSPTSQQQLNVVNQVLQDHLGLGNHEALYSDYKKLAFSPLSARSRPRPIVFTLVCGAGHRLDYNITCP